MQPLDGKVALVTGGGRGLGESICRVLSGSGVHVACADIDEALARRVVDDLNRTGPQSIAVKLDVADEQAVSAVVDRVVRSFGTIDILVNNAGVDVTLPVDELSVAQWDAVVGVNLRGPFLVSKRVYELMKARQAGHIVNIASTAAKRAWANASAYHASKWGLLGFSHALHVEARKYNIRVTAVVTGGMKTPFLLDRFPDIDLRNLQDPDCVAQTVKFVLLQPAGSVIPEITVLPLLETSWP